MGGHGQPPRHLPPHCDQPSQVRSPPGPAKGPVGIGPLGPCPGPPLRRDCWHQAKEAIMASREITELDGSQPTAEPTSRTEAAFGRIITERATKFLAVFRVVLGFEFLW